ncbi:DUF4145 domain-containing protein [Variovorax beijingensis]|uniref:DUF4145 domain-containing protein n=1 Tax=Variovorax beijingensis TaxID=2496117 RepID=UPI0013DF03BC|nr:DUF4145 domain-containing protein [Variovorax beijingensis]
MDHYYDENGELQTVYSVAEKLYPSRIAGYIGLKDGVWLLPDKLRRIYQETTNALTSDQHVLTGIGVRAILETLCKDQAAKGRTLFEQIDDLVQQGVLTPGRAAVLHQLRTLGNLAAHEVEPHNPQQLGLAMIVLDHLLEEVYILPAKAKKLFPPISGPTVTAPVIAALPPLPPGTVSVFPPFPGVPLPPSS